MKILVADDSMFVRRIITKTLQEKFPEAELFICSDGKAAYESYLANIPDVLITDLLMPEMTGQELLCKLKENGFKVPSIVISADIQNATKEELDSIGITEFINKPFSSEKLIKLVELIKEVCNA
jgi:two-component system chemotaxis response regulator CheY